MTDTPPVTTEDAARRFVHRLTVDAYHAAIRMIGEILQEGAPGRRPDPLYMSLHEWFGRLGPVDRAQVHAVIVETARMAVYQCFTTLDGVNGGSALPGRAADYALYLQVYADEKAASANQPEAAIRLSGEGGGRPYLYEIFAGAIQAEKERCASASCAV